MDTLRPSRAISAGFRKIPVPIMVPTTIAMEAHAPSPRTSSNRFSLIILRSRSSEKCSSTPAANRHEVAARCANIRLTSAPSTKVTHDPISTYQVNAIFV